MKTLSLDSFKTLVLTDSNFKDSLTNKSDVIDFDNGTMTIMREHINKYLEQYACKTEDELSDTLWYSYGVFVRVI